MDPLPKFVPLSKQGEHHFDYIRSVYQWNLLVVCFNYYLSHVFQKLLHIGCECAASKGTYC